MRNGYTQLLQLDWISAPAVGNSLGQIGSQLNKELFCTNDTVWLLYVYHKGLANANMKPNSNLAN